MTAESIVAAWLSDATIAALVGTRVALHELPQGSAYPNIAYHVVSAVPEPIVAYQQGPQRCWSRVQINPQALTLAEVFAMHDAIRALMDFKHTIVIAGSTVISSRVDTFGPVNKDVMTLAWTKPVDYKIYHLE